MPVDDYQTNRMNGTVKQLAFPARLQVSRAEKIQNSPRSCHTEPLGSPLNSGLSCASGASKGLDGDIFKVKADLLLGLSFWPDVGHRVLLDSQLLLLSGP